MGLFFKTYAELSEQAIQIFEKIRTKIVDGSDFTWVPYNNAIELHAEIDNCIENLRNQNKAKLDSIYSHFIATSTFQEHAMANGWHEEYLELAKKFDKIYEKMKQKK